METVENVPTVVSFGMCGPNFFQPRLTRCNHKSVNILGSSLQLEKEKKSFPSYLGTKRLTYIRVQTTNISKMPTL